MQVTPPGHRAYPHCPLGSSYSAGLLSTLPGRVRTCSVMRESETERERQRGTDGSQQAHPWVIILWGGHLAWYMRTPSTPGPWGLFALPITCPSLPTGLPEPSLLATTKIKRSDYPTRDCSKHPTTPAPPHMAGAWHRRREVTKEKRKALFSIHTGMLSGQERKLNFLGGAGPPDAVQAEKPRGRILPSLPTYCYTKSSQERKSPCSPGIRSPGYLHTWLRRVKQVPVFRVETTYSLLLLYPLLPCALTLGDPGAPTWVRLPGRQGEELLAGTLGTFYKPFPPHGVPCKLLRTRSRAQWGASAPRTTLVAHHPRNWLTPGEESQATERRWRQGGNQDPATRKVAHHGWGEQGQGEEQRRRADGGWRDRGGGVQSGGQSAGPAHTSAGSWPGCENSSILFQPISALARPLPDTCEVAQKCAPA